MNVVFFLLFFCSTCLRHLFQLTSTNIDSEIKARAPVLIAVARERRRYYLHANSGGEISAVLAFTDAGGRWNKPLRRYRAGNKTPRFNRPDPPRAVSPAVIDGLRFLIAARRSVGIKTANRFTPFTRVAPVRPGWVTDDSVAKNSVSKKIVFFFFGARFFFFFFTR